MRTRTDARAHRLPFPARRTGAALALALAVALAGCGGGDGPDIGGEESVRAADSTAAPGAGSPAGQVADTAAAPTSPSDSAGRAAGTGEGSEESGASLPAWSTEPRVVESGGGPGRMVGVRTGRHDGFDRLVLVFSDRVPGYTVGYPDEPLRRCGSGEPVDLAAPAVLHLHLQPASAHNQRGHSTLMEREISPGLPTLRTGRLTCDFEGHVEWAVGLERRTPFRAFTLDRPARLVVDVRHGEGSAGP